MSEQEKKYNVRCSTKTCGLLAANLTLEQALTVISIHRHTYRTHQPVWYAVKPMPGAKPVWKL